MSSALTKEKGWGWVFMFEIVRPEKLCNKLKYSLCWGSKFMGLWKVDNIDLKSKRIQ